MVNMQGVRYRIDVLLSKQSIAEFLQNQTMLNEVKTAKTKIIAEVALNDSIICTRLDYLFKQQH